MRRAAFEHLGTFIATFYVPYDFSSPHPFDDSDLMNNSLLSPHEEDGIWVGGADDHLTTPIDKQEGSHSDVGMEHRQKDGESEEPFFLFMNMPLRQPEREGQGSEHMKVVISEEGESGEGVEGVSSEHVESGEGVKGERDSGEHVEGESGESGEEQEQAAVLELTPVTTDDQQQEEDTNNSPQPSETTPSDTPPLDEGATPLDTPQSDVGGSTSDTPPSDVGATPSDTPPSDVGDEGSSASDTPPSDVGTTPSDTPPSDVGTTPSDVGSSGTATTKPIERLALDLTEQALNRVTEADGKLEEEKVGEKREVGGCGMEGGMCGEGVEKGACPEDHHAAKDGEGGGLQLEQSHTLSEEASNGQILQTAVSADESVAKREKESEEDTSEISLERVRDGVRDESLVSAKGEDVRGDCDECGVRVGACEGGNSVSAIGDPGESERGREEGELKGVESGASESDSQRQRGDLDPVTVVPGEKGEGDGLTQEETEREGGGRGRSTATAQNLFPPVRFS